jgi:hypothetical protein
VKHSTDDEEMLVEWAFMQFTDAVADNQRRQVLDK